jgi:predicted glycogen debranching enzyme
MKIPINQETEWLEADGLGGFSSGTTLGVRTRRYHSLLLTATTPPIGRVALVKGLETWVETGKDFYFLNPHFYLPGVMSPEKVETLHAFDLHPWPRWTYKLAPGLILQHELFVPHGKPMVVLSWKLIGDGGSARLSLRPLLSGSNYHTLHHENPDFQFDADIFDQLVRWRPYPSHPAITALHNGHYHHKPEWYRQFLYEKEKQRGMDSVEDLGSPGLFQWVLGKGRAVMILTTQGIQPTTASDIPQAMELYEDLKAKEEKRRKSFASPSLLSAENYFVKKGDGKILLAGYPWLTDWGRDTFISMRGLGIATGKLEESRTVLHEWIKVLSEGMVPNRLPGSWQDPDYASVDASLWFILACHDYLTASGKTADKELTDAIEKILTAYSKGTRFGIGMDKDGLLFAGEGDSALTWMDARVEGKAVTPRVGKPVEVQALWLNALWIGSKISKHWKEHLDKGLASFREKFWNKETGCLFDVIDVNRQPGVNDPAFRPNQIFAVGGLPLVLLDETQVRWVVDLIEKKLLTPVGLRSLAPGEPGYQPHLHAGVVEEGATFHQGVVWPWLMGPFVEAWVRSRGDTDEAKREARKKFLEPFLTRLWEEGLGHLPEVAEAEPPFKTGGCPFQAWSLGEALRLDLAVLKEKHPHKK